MTRGVLTTEGDAAQIRFERLIAAPPDRVWQVLTHPDELAAWLAPTRLEQRVGGAVQIEFDPDNVVTGTVTELEPFRRLAYTWLIAGENESQVIWTLTPEGDDATRLELVHHSLPTPMSSGYAAGWHAHLEALEAATRGQPAPDWDRRFEELLPSYSN